MLNVIVSGNLHIVWVSLFIFNYKTFSIHIVGGIGVETILIWRTNDGELISIFVGSNWDIDFPVEKLIQNVVWVILEVNEINLAHNYPLDILFDI